MVNKLELGRVFLPVLRSFPLSIIPPMLHTPPSCFSYQKDKVAKARECSTKHSPFSYREMKRTNMLQWCSEKSLNKQHNTRKSNFVSRQNSAVFWNVGEAGPEIFSTVPSFRLLKLLWEPIASLYRESEREKKSLTRQANSLWCWRQLGTLSNAELTSVMSNGCYCGVPYDSHCLAIRCRHRMAVSFVC